MAYGVTPSSLSAQEAIQQATELYQRLDEAKAAIDALSPSEQVDAYNNLYNESNALAQLQQKVQATAFRQPDGFIGISNTQLDELQEKLRDSAELLESIETKATTATINASL